MKTQKQIEKIRDELEVEIAYYNGMLSIKPTSRKIYIDHANAQRIRSKLIAKLEVLNWILQ